MTTLAAILTSRLSYELPKELEASEPPEARGLSRDAVRMLVAGMHDGSLLDSSFNALPALLAPGDLLVVNTSATIPAALDALADDGTALVVHLSTHLDVDRWVVELRRLAKDSTERWKGPLPSHRLSLAGDAYLVLEQPYAESDRLWIANLHLDQPVLAWLAVHGRPIRYRHVDRTWPTELYQNVYVTEPGSAEMPSAGRPFTTEMITKLVAKGIGVTPVVLHTGVASAEADEFPYPERVRVPESTAERVNSARRAGHAVIAIGTTVVRALETALSSDGLSHAYNGWTDAVVTPERGARAVDGLLTGWHEPSSSHLLMLEAVMGTELLERAYREALTQGYLWHEFGDVLLALP